MHATNAESHTPDAKSTVVEWLMDSDPSIRWQVMRDLTQAPAERVAEEHARVATEGLGAKLLDRQRPDGNWGDGIRTPDWRANLYTLLLLRTLGLDPSSERARSAITLVRERVDWGAEWGNSPFFEGEVEPCINGGVLAVGAYFGAGSQRLADRLLREQLADGGWNCDAERGSVRSSFHTTICVLEGLLEYEKSAGTSAAISDARARGHDYLLSRRMFRKLSSGDVIDPAKSRAAMPSWTQFVFPSMWQYDLLRGLDYLRSAGISACDETKEAVGVVAERRLPDGRWLLDAAPRDALAGQMECAPGAPSRWNTLRAMRVLNWFSTR
jgi:hypothetical protein